MNATITDYSELVMPIIRSADERTVEVCRFLVQSEFPDSKVELVRERPFSKTLRRSLELGLDSGKKWTLCIDADVLIAKGQLRRLVQRAETVNDDRIFELQARVIDKLFTIRRPAGNHIYRSSLLHRALSAVPKAGASLRPESDTINEMARSGFPWIQLPDVVGLHDYEQYFRDIYRKVFLQGRKFRHWSGVLLDRWKVLAQQDPDYYVAMHAWKDCEASWTSGHTDSATTPGNAGNVLAGKGLDEKPPLEEGGWWSDVVDEKLNGFRVERCLEQWEQKICFPFEVPLRPEGPASGQRHFLRRYLGKWMQRLSQCRPA